MDPEEEKNMKEVMDEVFGEFEGEIYFSTDGKHTVHAKASTAEGRKSGLEWAFKAYERIVERLGTKAEMWESVVNKTDKTQYKCDQCGQPAALKSGTSKTGKPWKGLFCSANKDHVKWIRD